MAQPEFVIEYLDPATLSAAPFNYRLHPDTQKEALQNSIEEHGWLAAPIVNRRNQRILDGHARVEIALQRGEATIPVRVVDVSQENEKRILASFDRTGEMRERDDQALMLLLQELSETEAGLPAGWNDEDLAELLGELEAAAGAGGGGSGDPAEARATLAERFGVPPFSVLDARQGYWQERKRAWIALGIQSELGRGDNTLGREPECEDYRGAEGDYSRSGAVVSNGEGGLVQRRAAARGYNASPGGSPRPAASLGADGKTVRGDGKGRSLARTFGQDLMRGEHVVGENRLTWVAGDRPTEELDEVSSKNLAAQSQSGTSIFDPVLCELAYRWFCPERGRVLDPFAGGSVRGIVAATLGRSYVGIDLSERQIAANQIQADALGLSPSWVVGDSRELGSLVEGEFDFLFSCPPYADLERYSDDPRDISTLDYATFMIAYRQIIAAAVARMKEDRFAFFVVGDVRDPKGFYRNFVADTTAAFQDAGMQLYNEAVLVTAVGSLPIRVGKQFGSYRKLGKTHQNCLCYYRGDPSRIKEIAADCQFGEIEGSLADDSAPV